MVEVEDDEAKLIREAREREEAKFKIEEEKPEHGAKGKSKLAPKKGGKAKGSKEWLLACHLG